MHNIILLNIWYNILNNNKEGLLNIQWWSLIGLSSLRQQRLQWRFCWGPSFPPWRWFWSWPWGSLPSCPSWWPWASRVVGVPIWWSFLRRWRGGGARDRCVERIRKGEWGVWHRLLVWCRSFWRARRLWRIASRRRGERVPWLNNGWHTFGCLDVVGPDWSLELAVLLEEVGVGLDEVSGWDVLDGEELLLLGSNHCCG